MKIAITCFFLCIVLSGYSQIKFKISPGKEDITVQLDSTVVLPVLHIEKQTLDSIISKIVEDLKTTKNKNIYFSIADLKDSIEMIEIVGDIPKRNINTVTIGLEGCILYKDFTIYVYNYHHIDINHFFMKTGKKIYCTKLNGNFDDLDSQPAYYYFYNKISHGFALKNTMK